MTGTIVQINISPGGLPKRPIPGDASLLSVSRATLTPIPQIHGGPRQAVLLIAAETIEDSIARGYPLFYGALGENLTTRGLDPRQLRIGQQLRAGGGSDSRSPRCAVPAPAGCLRRPPSSRKSTTTGESRRPHLAALGHERILRRA